MWDHTGLGWVQKFNKTVPRTDSEGHPQTQMRGHMKIQAESGTNAVTNQGIPEATRSWKKQGGFYPRDFGGV